MVDDGGDTFVRSNPVLSKTSPVHLSVPNAENKRVLYEGRVIDLDGQRVVAEFDQTLTLAEGSEVMLFAEVRGKFFQQGATVTQQRQDTPLTTIEFHTKGDPVSAEQRGSYRTSVVTSKVPVRIDRIAGCVLADISPEGVGVICPKPLTIGTTVDVAFDFEGQTIAGRLRVQSVKMLPNGSLRFGLFVAEKRDPLRARLATLASLAQRMQLRRLSGAA
jgi:hypothetical protein